MYVYLKTCCTLPARAAANAFIYIHKQTHVPENSAAAPEEDALGRKIQKDGGEERVCEMKSADGHTHTTNSITGCAPRTAHVSAAPTIPADHHSRDPLSVTGGLWRISN